MNKPKKQANSYRKTLEKKIQTAHKKGKKLGIDEQDLGKTIGSTGGFSAGDAVEVLNKNPKIVQGTTGIEENEP